MLHNRSQSFGRGVARPMLVVLATATGFLFAGAGLDAGAPLAARAAASHAAAVRVALGIPLFEPLSETRNEPPLAEALAPAARQPLLAGEEAVRLSRHASRVRIPSVGIDAEVRTVGYVFQQGVLQYDVPRIGAGQYAGTAAPGEPGNTVIAGHVASRSGPAVFRELPQVRIGETVELFRGDQLFRYIVTEIRVVAAGATAVMWQTDDATLTLITCSMERNFERRFVVVGKLL